MKKPLAVGVVIVAGMVLFRGTRGRLNQSEQGAAANVGPGGPTLYYWRELGLRSRSADQTSHRIIEEQARFQSGVITEAADLRGYWKGCADLYGESADNCRSAVAEIEGLIRIGVDAEALAVGSAAVDYLKGRCTLHRDSAADCQAYSELYADVVKAGGKIDEATPAGQKLAKREEEIRAAMLDRAADGKQDKAELQSLLTLADATRSLLTARYHRDFSDFNKR